MPRNHAPGPSTLRNRNRVTNKTRLRVIKGNVEGDHLTYDENEQKARQLSTAGVDTEDANEHHLQAVLNAASVRHQIVQRPARGGSDKAEKQPDAYIPIPDNTGLVDDYATFYPPGKWKDPVSFVKTSATAEDAVTAALIDGFTYYMDERDKEWLDKNNEEARGEGTSAQGAVSATGIRTSQRSSKAKGKEPELVQPIVISEDEFELVMGIFEKVTHDKTPFLYHGLTEGSPFPPFSDYQDIFVNTLLPSMFAVFVVPTWVPQPAHMLKLAKMVYPYWKERRIERGGHRVIPTLNYDESDVKNESYICFRRRDVKAMRKTRASQASSSEKLVRLQQELATVQELSKSLCTREALKRELLQFNQAVWDGREKIVDLKRKFPSLGTKEDDELLVDKERAPKRPKAPEPKIKIPAKLPKDSSAPSALADETIMKPRERQALIAKRVDEELQMTRERDQMWDDALDNSYQPQPATHGQRLFKFVLEKPQAEEDAGPATYRAVRTRRGRGGVLRFDRRPARIRAVKDEDFIRSLQRPSEDTDPVNDDEARDRAWRLRTQWMHDNDDEPHVGPDGLDEQDRVLVDEFNTTTMRKTMRLFTERDNQMIQTDPSLHWRSPTGEQRVEVPFKIGIGFTSSRRDAQQQQAQQAAMLRQQQAQQMAKAHAQQVHVPGLPIASGSGQQTLSTGQQPNGVSIAHPQASSATAMQTPIRRSSSSMGSQMRISSGAPMRPPATPTAPPMPSTPTHASPPHPTASSPSANGDTHHTSAFPPLSIQDMPSIVAEPTAAPAMPSKPTPSHQSITIPNGFHMSNFNPALANGVAGTLQSAPQVSNIQQLNAYMNMANMNGSRPAAYIGPTSINYPVNAALNLKLPTARQNQWIASQAPAPPPTVAIAHSRAQGALANGAHVSPGRASQSPSMQHQQIVGSASGY